MHSAASTAALGKCAQAHHSRVARATAVVPRLELADIFRQFGAEYCRTHTLLPSQYKALLDIVECRTAALGGRLEKCNRCGHENPVYCSCSNRHCPKCQQLAKAKWLEAGHAELLPVPYFHAVFTLPHVLNPLIFDNQRLLYQLLFECVSKTLQEFAADPRHGLGGKLGFTALLHTWDQQLNCHVNLHCLIPAGVLACDKQQWIHARPNYLFDVEALSLVFRGKFRAGLQDAFENKQLPFSAQVEHGKSQSAFRGLITQLYKTKWVVYLKPPFSGPEQGLHYLARYTQRIAISNSRLLQLQNGRVRFRYRDRRDGDRLNETDLAAEEFIRRFLQHVLPKAFVRLRHFGFLANGCKQFSLQRCRELLRAGPPLPKPARKTVQEWMKKLTGVDVALCPHCRVGKLLFVRELLPQCPRLHFPEFQAPRTSATAPQGQAGDTS
jgi:hypothetical protein